MSCFPHVRPPLPPSAPPDLTAIAALLRQTAEALLTFGNMPEAALGKQGAPEKPFSDPIEEGYRRGEFHEEIRCFRLPRAAVRAEYELSQQYGPATFPQLINRVYDELFAAVLLMRRHDESAGLSGLEAHLLDENLSRPLGLLHALRAPLASVELVRKTTVPA